MNLITRERAQPGSTIRHSDEIPLDEVERIGI
jgi:hypothetical protein